VPFTPDDGPGKVRCAAWISSLEALNVVGTFETRLQSDITGDSRAGARLQCRLSLPQVKSAFLLSQDPANAVHLESPEHDMILEFDEMLVALARCGLHKYRPIKELDARGRVLGMVQNVLGDLDEETVLQQATQIRAPRFNPLDFGADDELLQMWTQLRLQSLPGFPLWEQAVFEDLQSAHAELQLIFQTYAAGTAPPDDFEGIPDVLMDIDEFRDLLVESGLPTDAYGLEAMSGHFISANEAAATNGSSEPLLEFPEFVTAICMVAFFRANPMHALTNTDSQIASGRKDADFDGVADGGTTLPAALHDALHLCILPNARKEPDPSLFRLTTLQEPEVQDALHREVQRVQEVVDAAATSAADIDRGPRGFLSDLYEQISQGREFLQLEQWLNAIEERLLIGEVRVIHIGKPYTSRFSRPLAKAVFVASAAVPSQGLLPDEFLECVARSGVAKYRGVPGMTPGARVAAFISNLSGEADEEDAIQAALGAAAQSSDNLMDDQAR